MQLRKNLIIVIAGGKKEYTFYAGGSFERLTTLVRNEGAGARNRISDLTDCEREPIHIPGSIQPHGVLLAIDPASLKVVQIAGDTNTAAWP